VLVKRYLRSRKSGNYFSVSKIVFLRRNDGEECRRENLQNWKICRTVSKLCRNCFNGCKTANAKRSKNAVKGFFESRADGRKENALGAGKMPAIVYAGKMPALIMPALI
jgi:hypothetical protein